MELQKIILYYGFAPVTDPEAVRLWQTTLCDSLGLKGRILISRHGINGTLGGDMSALKSYVKQTRQYPGFKKIDFKWSDGTGEDFPRLSVKVRDELVSFGVADEIKVDAKGVIDGGEHLTPEEVHKLIEERGDEVVFFDGRNSYEAKVGKFKNAVVPEVKTTKDFIGEIESGKFDHLKTKPIVTYCTGGIRCEILSSVMKKRGFEEVYQIEGGIVLYGERYGNQGYWEGSLYTFDGRMTVDFSPDTKIIGECDLCGSPTKSFTNCANQSCHQLYLLCGKCLSNPANIECTHVASETLRH
ncbi:MAG: rhodanese-related sulfurtransferase [Actinobacteria bacterium]|nr:rhodanese-related sulfurtransferase [Actinomycetota bacterium]